VSAPDDRSVLTSDGLRLHVDVSGADDADVTVVLAHGWTQSMHTWRYQARDLPGAVDTPIRVLRYDHRGHGRSDGTAECDATVDNLARDLAAVIDTLAPDRKSVV
jgi:pimeloyl-ACP methyl ester carboxylesterase